MKLLRSTAILMPLAIFASPAAAQHPTWKLADAQADWGDRDLGYCSAGPTPQARYCDPNHVGMVAVCWRAAGCGNAQGWCTYKNSNPSTTPDGASPGNVYYCAGNVEPGDLIVVPHIFEARESGDFLIKTSKEMSSQEFQNIIMGGCWIFDVDCSDEAAAIRQGADYVNGVFSNAYVHTTAFIDTHEGEHYQAKFVAPDGYTTCKAKIDSNNGSITGESTFSGILQRMTKSNGDGIGLDVVVPQNRDSGQWAAFMVYVEYARKDRVGRFDCWPDNTSLWLCGHGSTGCRILYPGAHY
jgi:hypothetical protein